MAQARSRDFIANIAGGPLVDFALFAPVFILFLGLLFDFTLAFWQWNAALKALERGARIAAVTYPVAPNLAGANAIASACTGGTCQGGESYLSTPSYAPDFTVTCSGLTALCTCAGNSEACQDIGASTAANATAFKWIVYGRGQTGTTCPTAVGGTYMVGMCQFLPMLSPALSTTNVQVIYKASRLGYFNRPDGPVVTITVQYEPTNPPRFRFVFLGWLLQPILMSMTNGATVTSEDLCGANSC